MVIAKSIILLFSCSRMSLALCLFLFPFLYLYLSLSPSLHLYLFLPFYLSHTLRLSLHLYPFLSLSLSISFYLDSLYFAMNRVIGMTMANILIERHFTKYRANKMRFKYTVWIFDFVIRNELTGSTALFIAPVYKFHHRSSITILPTNDHDL